VNDIPQPGSYALRSKATGYVVVGWLSDEPAYTVGARNWNEWPTDQRWRFEGTDFGCYRLVHDVTGRVLDSDENRQVYISTPNDGSFQKWRMNPGGEGDWCLQNLATGFALDGNADRDVYTMEPNDGAYQRWQFIPV